MNTASMVVKNDFLSKYLCEELLALGKDVWWRNAFLKKDCIDPSRHEGYASYRDKSVQDVIRRLNEEITSWNSTWVLGDVWFTRAEERCGRQAPHRDFPLSKVGSLSAMKMPGSCVVCLENDVVISFFGTNRLQAVKDEERVVVLSQGSLALFRGDVIHCDQGTAGPTTTHLQCRMVSEDYHMESECLPEYVPFEEFFCSSCQQPFLSKKELKLHIRSCTTFICPVCPKSYGRRQGAAFRKHKQRTHGHKA